MSMIKIYPLAIPNYPDVSAKFSSHHGFHHNLRTYCSSELKKKNRKKEKTLKSIEIILNIIFVDNGTTFALYNTIKIQL